MAAGELENLVPLKDYDGLAATIQRFMYRPNERKKLSKKLRYWAQVKFAVPDMLDSYLQVYESLLGRSPVSSPVSCEES